MALNKVEICGVNTSRLPVLTEDEKEFLFELDPEMGDEECKGAVPQMVICGWYSGDNQAFCKQQ